jgi:predicted anti-sigma-YlaC factor YlaD
MGIAVAGRGIQSDMSVIERLLVGGCEETRERLSDIADGEARGIRGWRARAHLARCELCQAAYDSLLRTVERLRTLREADRPPSSGSVADAVVERVRHEPPAP